jgi:hypothetical protein
MTAEHQRKVIQEQIDACDTIIREYEARRAARSQPNREIEDLRRRQKELKTEIPKLSDKNNLAQSFQLTCGQLYFEVVPKKAEKAEEPVIEINESVTDKTATILKTTRTPIKWPAWLNIKNTTFAILGAGILIG